MENKTLLHLVKSEPKNLLEIVLLYLHEPSLRDASENLVKLGVITKEQYTKHWYIRCRERSHQIPFVSSVDYGWIFAITEFSAQDDIYVNVLCMSKDEVITMGFNNDAETREIYWLNKIYNNKSRVAVPRICDGCRSVEKKCRDTMIGETDLGYEYMVYIGNHRGHLYCDEHERTTTMLMHFYRLANMSNQYSVFIKTVEYMMKHLRLYFDPCYSGKIGVIDNIKNFYGEYTLDDLFSNKSSSVGGI